jgi:hypothetical protein
MSEGSLRRRVPDLAIEALFIFVAVLLALAADEWRESRDRADLADRALRGILLEIRNNRTELGEPGIQNLAEFERVTRELSALDEGENPESLAIDFQVALISSAAWEAARMSQAVHYIGLERTTRLAELYEMQELFERAQSALVDQIIEIGRAAREDPRGAAKDAAGRLGVVVRFHEALVAAYDEVLANLDGV